MPRGRPRKLGDNPELYTETDHIVSEYLAKLCEIPGCIPRNHVEDARIILNALERDHQLKLKRLEK